MNRWKLTRTGSAAVGLALLVSTVASAGEFKVGFAAREITPAIGTKPVYIAGFGHNRKATGVADPIMARAIVLVEGSKKIALVSVDLVGFFHDYVERVRAQLPGFAYVLVSSTHSHEGPDTLGLWGSTPFTSGIDPDYIKFVEGKIVEAVKEAEAGIKPATASIGAIPLPDLIHDAREPQVKHDELVAVMFSGSDKKPLGIMIQWNCHPETLGDKNTRLSTDYVGYTVDEVAKKYGCPVAYFTGTVGGLMTSLHVKIQIDGGPELKDGTFEKTERLGRLVGQGAIRALAAAKPVNLTPFDIRRRDLYLPVDNKMYLLGRQIGVLKRDAYLWTGDWSKAGAVQGKDSMARLCMKTEVGRLRLGDLEIAMIPGEIYPELVLGKVPDPAPAGADFPDAPTEPSIYGLLRGKHKMLIGLANDELGYIIPRRQWDEKAPYTYGRKSAPYGEVNSLGPDTAPLLCEAFRTLCTER